MTCHSDIPVSVGLRLALYCGHFDEWHLAGSASAARVVTAAKVVPLSAHLSRRSSLESHAHTPHPSSVALEAAYLYPASPPAQHCPSPASAAVMAELDCLSVAQSVSDTAAAVPC